MVQHAEAKPEEEDPSRPLSKKGEEEAVKVARFLGKFVRVSKILHSGKLRALQTAKILAEELLPEEVREAPGLTPLDDPLPWVEKLKGTEEDLMLVGHMPHLGKLASLLLSGEEEKVKLGFKPGTVACLEREGEKWVLKWMLPPEIL